MNLILDDVMIFTSFGIFLVCIFVSVFSLYMSVSMNDGPLADDDDGIDSLADDGIDSLADDGVDDGEDDVVSDHYIRYE